MAKKEKPGMKTSTMLDIGSMGVSGVEAGLPVITKISGAAAQGVLGPLAFGLQAGAAAYRISEDEKALAEGLGMTPDQFAMAAHTSRVLQERKARDDEMRAHAVGDAAASTGASMAAGMLGQALIPIPFVGFGVGAIAGGMGGSMLYNLALVSADKNVAKLAVDIDSNHRQATEGEVFALLASNLPPSITKHMFKELKRKTGHDNFLDALNDGGIPEDFMDRYRTTMRAFTQVDRDGTDKSAVQQLTDQLNAGKITAKDLLVTRDMVQHLMAMNQEMAVGYAPGDEMVPPSIPFPPTPAGGGARSRGAA